MGGPELLIGAAIATTVAGTAVSVLSSTQGGAASQNQANYQAAVAENNRIISEQNAQAATDAGEASSQTSQMRTAQQIGAKKAAAAASGVDIGSGSPLDVIADTSRIGMLDALTIKNNAARAAYGYKVQGQAASAQGVLDIYQGENARRAGDIGAIGSVLGGARSLTNIGLLSSRTGIGSGDARGLLLPS